MALSGRQFLEQQLTELTRAVTLEHVGDVAALPRGADEPPLPTNAVMQAALRKGAATVGFSSTLLFSLSLSLARLRCLSLSLLFSISFSRFGCALCIVCWQRPSTGTERANGEKEILCNGPCPSLLYHIHCAASVPFPLCPIPNRVTFTFPSLSSLTLPCPSPPSQ